MLPSGVQRLFTRELISLRCGCNKLSERVGELSLELWHSAAVVFFGKRNYAGVDTQKPQLRSETGGDAFCFLADGCLKSTNNPSERGLRGIAVGRKNWLFCGSEEHAKSAVVLFSLVAS